MVFRCYHMLISCVTGAGPLWIARQIYVGDTPFVKRLVHFFQILWKNFGIFAVGLAHLLLMDSLFLYRILAQILYPDCEFTLPEA